MIISSRQAHIGADRQVQRRITALMRAISDRIGGVLVRLAGEDGVLSLADLDTLKTATRESVESQFVQRERVEGDALAAERARLEGLITQGRGELRGASQAEQARISARVYQLGERLRQLTASGVIYVALRAGHPVTPYARIIMDGAEAVTRGVITRHASEMQRLLRDAPDVLRWLNGPVRIPFRDTFMTHQPIGLWRDVRGYTLSDRIWRTNEQTIARIDALLADGITRGRAAVDIAKDLERFLLPTRRRVVTRTPYGTIGSFDARRLARSEITRAASLSTYVAGVTNPFVTRARYHLSGVHDPKNCDGSCDNHAAEDQANGGFPPGEVPLPMIDTHPQCMCYITHETADLEQVIGSLREQMNEDLVSGFQVPGEPPVTPILVDLLVSVLLGWAVNELVTGA